MKLYQGTIRPNRNQLSSVNTLDSGFTTSRAHTPVDAVTPLAGLDGTYVEYEQNVPRYSSGALVVEEARTNEIINPSGEGGAGSPTGWTSFTNMIGRGVEDGLPYVDVRFSGASGTTLAGTFQAALLSVPGEVNTMSAYARLVDGSLTNVTAVQLSILYRDSGAGVTLNALQDITTAIQTATSIGDARHVLTATAPALTADKFARFRWVTTGAYDFTVRFAGVQMEVGTGVSSLILPLPGTLTATTRATDMITKSITPTVGASRNLFLNSEDINAAGWGRSQITVVSAATAGPYTGTFGDAIIASVTTSAHSFNQSVAGTNFTLGKRYVHSIYVKAGTYNFFRFNITGGLVNNVPNGIYFDLTTGAVTIAGSIPAACNPVYTAKSIGGGWWRLSVAVTAISVPATSAATTHQFTPSTASSSYTGDGISETGYVWGAQTTESDAIPAYVQTTTSVAAPHSKGTLYVSGRMLTIPPAGHFPTFISVYDDNNNHMTWFYNSGVNSLSFNVVARGVGLWDSQFEIVSPPTVNVYGRMALSWDTSTGVFAGQAHNGTSLSAVSTATLDLLPVFNTVALGYNPAIFTQHGMVEIDRSALYKTVIPGDMLHQLIGG